FRALFGGKVVSNLGDWLDILALLTLILYRWNLGPLAWGAYLTAFTLPYAVVGPVAGVWVDRLPRRTVMIACDLARAVVVLGLVWAPNLAAVLVLVTIKSTFSTFFNPAEQAMIRSTVPDDDLVAANSLNKLSDNGARLLGPGLGGLILAVAGLRGAFVADSISFLLSALILTRLPRIVAPPTAAQITRRFWPEFRAGVTHIARRQALMMAVGSMVAAAFLIRATDTIGVVILKDLGVTAGQLGLSFTCLGVGYVAGAIVVGQWGHRVSPLLVMGLAVLELGSLMAMMGMAVVQQMSGGSVAFFAAFPSRLLLGIGFAAGGVAYGAIVQRETPADLMGRVSATTEMLITVVPLAAPFLVSLIAAWLGVGWAFAIAGGGLMIVGAVVVLARGVPVGVAEVARNE
ncbi:MAG: MFS transporter, partial [Thermomicrobiales bacterium]